ncbi:MAG: menaquinone biosynthetic enzyme MqnA/MqnD family protein [Armatimonadota bacterium]
MNGKIRIGAVPYLNARPLIWALGRERGDRYELCCEVPSRLAQSLGAGEVDVALLPAFAYLCGTGDVVVPGVSISCRGPAASVKLFSRVPLPEVRQLATDASSSSSAALAQVLLRERYRAEFTVASVRPDLEAMLAQADAALLIGDLALRASHPDAEVICDLGEEWYNWQHLPFTFALWVAGAGVAPEVAADLLWAKEQGLANMATVVAEESAKSGLSAAGVAEYLQQNLDYHLTEDHLEGLRTFGRLCLAHGLVDNERDFNFLRPD